MSLHAQVVAALTSEMPASQHHNSSMVLAGAAYPVCSQFALLWDVCAAFAGCTSAAKKRTETRHLRKLPISAATTALMLNCHSRTDPASQSP